MYVEQMLRSCRVEHFSAKTDSVEQFCAESAKTDSVEQFCAESAKTDSVQHQERNKKLIQ